MMVSKPYREFRKQDSLDSIWFPIEPSPFDAFSATVVWDNQKLIKKDTFHFTVLHVETACELMRAAGGLQHASAEEKVTAFFNTFVEKHPIDLVSFQDDFRYAQKDEKRTVVVRCIASNLTEFFAELNHTFGIDMPIQPTHVTLYTLQKNVGIHIPSDEVMNSLPNVNIPELAKALKGVHI